MKLLNIFLIFCCEAAKYYIAMIFNQLWNLNGFQPFIDILSKVIERLAQALR
jgi:hypothetical protein